MESEPQALLIEDQM
jgi:hypothetical protein